VASQRNASKCQQTVAAAGRLRASATNDDHVSAAAAAGCRDGWHGDDDDDDDGSGVGVSGRTETADQLEAAEQTPTPQSFTRLAFLIAAYSTL